MASRALLLPGGAEFIGSDLVRALLRESYVRARDNVSTGHRPNIADLNVPMVEGVCAPTKGVPRPREEPIESPTRALSSVARSVQDPIT